MRTLDRRTESTLEMCLKILTTSIITDSIVWTQAASLRHLKIEKQQVK